MKLVLVSYNYLFISSSVYLDVDMCYLLKDTTLSTILISVNNNMYSFFSFSLMERFYQRTLEESSSSSTPI